jgi:hypothetical protein
MKPVRPPDTVLRAYADLLNQVFLFTRGRSHDKALDNDELFDLADAMHNVGGILADYGVWTDDDKYQRLYLRPLTGSGETRAFNSKSSFNPGWMCTRINE